MRRSHSVRLYGRPIDATVTNNIQCFKRNVHVSRTWSEHRYPRQLICMPMKLSALPTAFGVCEPSNDFFSYLINTRRNQEYISPYSPASYYGCNYMSTEYRKCFIAWHKGQNDSLFDIKRLMDAPVDPDDSLTNSRVQYSYISIHRLEWIIHTFDSDVPVLKPTTFIHSYVNAPANARGIPAP